MDFSKYINRTGYLKGSDTENNPFNIIPTGNITMKGVSKELMAIPVKNGIPQKAVNMKPNEKFNFDADFVIELPKLQDGRFFGGNNIGLYNPLFPPPLDNSLEGIPAQNQGLFQRRATRQFQKIDDASIQSEIAGAGDVTDPTGSTTTQVATPPSNSVGAQSGAQVAQAQARIQSAEPQFNLQTPEGIRSDLDGNLIIPEGSSQEDINQVRGINPFNQLFNPFGGVDLSSALFKAGQSFGSEGSTGNTIRGIGAVGKSVLNIGRLVGAGLGVANRDREVNNFYTEQQRKALANSNFRNEDGGLFYFLKNGGQLGDLTPEQALTGEYITGLPEHAQEEANAEIEVDEYVKHPNGDVQKVVGKTHEKGGEKVNLESGTKVVSDNLKVGADFAKMLRKEYNIKVKAKDTYATAISKYTKKLGLNKLNEEQEKLFIKVKAEEDTEDESTQNLNKEFLSGRINEIEEEKSSLEIQRASFTDLVFQKQEEAKGTDLPELESFKNGGMIKNREFQKLIKKHNLTEEQAMSFMDNLKNGGIKKYQDGGGDELNLNPNKFNTNDLSPRQRQRFSNLRGNNLISGNIKTEEELQARMMTLLQQHPVLAKQAFNISTNENGTLDFDVTEESISNFQQGFNTNFNALNDFVSSSANFSDSEKIAINESIQNEIFIEGDTNNARDFDGILGNFTSSRPGATVNTVTPEDLETLKSQGIVSYKQLLDDNGQVRSDLNLSENSVKALGNFTDFSGNFLLDKFDIAEPEVDAPTPISALTPAPEKPEIKAIRQRLGFPLLPDQSALPPDGVQPHVKISRRLERLDPVKITTEENLKEINRNQDFVAQQVAGLPDSQRRAFLANSQANSQEAINKAVTSTNIANAQNFQQTEQFNIGQSNQEENFRAQDTLDFERRQLTALAKTEADIFNFFEFNRKVQLGNFNTVNRMNTLNSIYENFNTDGSGIAFDTRTNAGFSVNPNQGVIPTTVNINNRKTT